MFNSIFSEVLRLSRMLITLQVIDIRSPNRGLERFIRKHFKKLSDEFDPNWKKPPGYTTVSNIIQGLLCQESPRERTHRG